MIFASCLFLFHQFTQRNEPDQIIADMDALAAFSAAFIRCPDIDRLDQLMGRIRRQFGHIRILPDLLNEKFKMITHNEELAQLADRVIRIEDGRIISRR